jgi:hypothetical protein
MTLSPFIGFTNVQETGVWDERKVGLDVGYAEKCGVRMIMTSDRRKGRGGWEEEEEEHGENLHGEGKQKRIWMLPTLSDTRFGLLFSVVSASKVQGVIVICRLQDLRTVQYEVRVRWRT